MTAGVRYLLIGFVGVGRGVGGGAGKSSRYDAYRDRWADAKRADARLHEAHDQAASGTLATPPRARNASQAHAQQALEHSDSFIW